MFFAAPVARLAKLSNSPSIEEPDRKALKALLARRLIAQSRYEDAVPFLPEDQVAAMELRKLSGKPDAATWLHMARLWSASRGRWLAFMPKPKDALEGDGLAARRGERDRDLARAGEERGRVVRDGSDPPRLARAEKILKLARSFGLTAN